MNARIAGALALALPFLLAEAASAQGCGHGAFNGLYGGGTIGLASADTKISSPDDPTLKDRDTSFAGSGFLGYNMQCGQTVFGIEGDAGFLGLEGKGQLDSPFGPVHLKDEIDWLITLRARAGVLVSPDAMIYVTGGLALADISHKLSIPGAGFEQTNSGWETGWTIGGGLDYALRPGWSLRAEVLYVDLGSQTHTYTVNGGPCVGICTDTAKWDDSFWVSRVGLSYKFDTVEERHAPMK